MNETIVFTKDVYGKRENKLKTCRFRRKRRVFIPKTKFDGPFWGLTLWAGRKRRKHIQVLPDMLEASSLKLLQFFRYRSKLVLCGINF